MSLNLCSIICNEQVLGFIVKCYLLKKKIFSLTHKETFIFLSKQVTPFAEISLSLLCAVSLFYEAKREYSRNTYVLEFDSSGCTHYQSTLLSPYLALSQSGT